MVRSAAEAQLGRPVDIPEGAVRDALDPVANVARRKLIGGPAPSSVQSMIDTARNEIEKEEGDLEWRLKRLDDATAQLEGIISKMID
jgi:argininosuccinate lyase